MDEKERMVGMSDPLISAAYIMLGSVMNDNE